MTRASCLAPAADAIEYSEELDATVVAWNLDELDQYSDLDSVRWARDREDA